jgi:2-polyprenyl-3-methyl-5-hydroxy-6-metoxy-1,4-benzoquinol methylase
MNRLALSKLSYLVKSCLGYFTPRLCPACGSRNNLVVDAKYGVTRLLECQECFLRFRHPVDTEKFNFSFYQKRYIQPDTITTELPSEEKLKIWLDSNFKNSPKNARTHIDILRALSGNLTNLHVLDYGASWGYTALQFKHEGMKVSCYEISEVRADFGRKLGINYYAAIDEIDCIHDVFYSSHVIEHLPSPEILFNVAGRSLKKGGLLILFCPNGSADHQKANKANYHQGWGLVHPLYLTGQYFAKKLKDRPYFITSSPFPLDKIGNWAKKSQLITDLSGHELLVISIW